VGTALISQTIVEDDRWHHVASTYDGQTFRLFVDGVEEGSIAYSDGIAPNTAPVQIGWDPFTDGGRLNNRFSGLIDDARIYNRGLAACEIAELAGTGSCNSPPDATAAAPTPESIWPPNNKMVDVTIGGVTDPDGDDVTITITGIINEETGTDDAGGIGTSTAQVRASRDGKGDGRVYVISFNASDGNGGTDTGTVTVTVPHDQGKRRGRAKAAAAVRGASWGELKESVR
jgi:hypothetical protein